MELLILDSDFKELGTIELFSSLIWTRRYYSPGEFELHCSTEYFNLVDEGTYLYRKNYELAVIEQLEILRNFTGDSSLKVSGLFIESILNDRALPGVNNFTGTQEVIARTIVNSNFIAPADIARKVNRLSLGALKGLGTTMTLGTENEYVGNALYNMLKDKEMSQRIRYDYVTDNLYYEVWQGLDRTDNQTVNSQAVFSDNLENVMDDTYSVDRKDYKNFCYVVGTNNVIVSVNKVPPGGRRKELIVSTGETNQQIMTTEGNMQLIKNPIVEIFDGRIAVNANFIYLKDFNVGDLCTFINTSIGKMANKRITEIKEVYENGNVNIYPVFGDDYITLNQKITREVRR